MWTILYKIDSWGRAVQLNLIHLVEFVSARNLRYWYTVSVYQHRSDIESRGCYDLGCCKGSVMQMSNWVLCNVWSEFKLLQLCRNVTDDRNWEGKQSTLLLLLPGIIPPSLVFSFSPLSLSVKTITVHCVCTTATSPHLFCILVSLSGSLSFARRNKTYHQQQSVYLLVQATSTTVWFSLSLHTPTNIHINHKSELKSVWLRWWVFLLLLLLCMVWTLNPKSSP